MPRVAWTRSPSRLLRPGWTSLVLRLLRRPPSHCHCQSQPHDVGLGRRFAEGLSSRRAGRVPGLGALPAAAPEHDLLTSNPLEHAASGRRHIFLPRIRWRILRGALSGESMVITKLNRSLAKQDPEGTFENPLVIVDETMFTRGEKIATLDRWRKSILAELTAVGEVKRARLLGEIQEARNRLRQ